jgi:hypothetical protein
MKALHALISPWLDVHLSLFMSEVFRRDLEPPNKMGRTYLRPNTGTWMPSEERFRNAPGGACLKRRPLIEISTFRVGQQPKLREISCVLSLSHLSVSNGRSIVPSGVWF